MNHAVNTAQMSAFLRAWHWERHAVRVFEDPAAFTLFRREELSGMEAALQKGAGFFLPDFSGPPEDAVEEIMRRRLAPAPLARAAFGEQALKTAALLGAEQYLILAAGYDTFPYRQPLWAKKLTIFELDRPEVLADQRRRLEEAGFPMPQNLRYAPGDLRDPQWPQALGPDFDPGKTTFVSFMGLSHYLSREDLGALLGTLNSLLSQGSSLAFDYPSPDQPEFLRSLASGAGEPMDARYSYREMERLLSDRGFRIYEHLDAGELADRYFALYDRANPQKPMEAPAGTCCCLAVKK